MYDCIIIGAGPAGSTAAKILAEKGLKVLLVEKFKLPRHKSCSGILIKKSMDLVKLYFGESTPLFTMCAPARNKGMIFTTDKGREYRFDQEGLNVWRSSFDNWLTTKAVQSGAVARDCTAAIDCKEQDGYASVTLHGEKTYTEDAKYVLDCEGVVGSLKRRIIAEPQGYITTFQTFNKGTVDLDYHYFYAYLQPDLSEYDAWFNVKDNLLALGVSVKKPSKIQTYYACFLAHMKELHGLQIHKEIKSEKWLMPHVRPGCAVKYGAGRVFFAGEAAGFLNPMGEGISAAMESGQCLARAVLKHFGDMHMIYAEYQQSTAMLKTYMERQWSFVAGMADTFAEMKLNGPL